MKIFTKIQAINKKGRERNHKSTEQQQEQELAKDNKIIGKISNT